MIPSMRTRARPAWCLRLLCFVALLPAATGSVAVRAQDAVEAESAAAADPFSARVPVADDSNATRDQALREALSRVLETVVGRKDPAFAPMLSRAPQWAQQYGLVSDSGESGLALVARFDEQAVKDALSARGLPVFGIDASMIEGWALQIAGVHAASDYSQLIDYLGSLRGVRRVEVEELRDDLLRLRLTVEGGVASVAAQVEDSRVVRREGEGFYVFVGS